MEGMGRDYEKMEVGWGDKWISRKKTKIWPVDQSIDGYRKKIVGGRQGYR